MERGSGNQRGLVISYLALRRAIGIIGIALPFALYFGARVFFDTGMQRSMSAYYHTGMRDVFVGALCVIGVFLFSYRGDERIDNVIGNLACAFAVGTALFRTAPPGTPESGADVIGYLHFAFAFLFFATLIYFSLFLFTKTDPDPGTRPTRKKLQRNRVYRICGYAMSACILLIMVNALLEIIVPNAHTALARFEPVFWLEALAVFSFGISWFTKGEAILKDGD